MANDFWFERLADADTDIAERRAPARLKSQIYSALVSRMAASNPLLDLTATSKAGGHLCVFEQALTVLPVDLQKKNPCRVCHARLLGERLEHAPIFWPGCPYSDFHRD